MKINTVLAGIVSAFAIRCFAIAGAVAISGSWWIAIVAIFVLDCIEGAGRREVGQWQKIFKR